MTLGVGISVGLLLVAMMGDKVSFVSPRPGESPARSTVSVPEFSTTSSGAIASIVGGWVTGTTNTVKVCVKVLPLPESLTVTLMTAMPKLSAAGA